MTRLDSFHTVIAQLTVAALVSSMVTAQAPMVDTVQRRSCSVPRPLAGSEDTKPPRKKDAVPHCLTQLEVFADGNIKNVLGNSDVNSVASGALGLRVVGSRFQVSGLINVAGPSDTVTSAFGATLLAPATGRSLNAASLVVRQRLRDWGDPACLRYNYPQTCNQGFRIEVNATSRLWATETRVEPPNDAGRDTTKVVTATSQVPMYGIDAAWSYEFFRGAIVSSDSAKRAAAMWLDVGYSRRAIRGDIGSTSEETTAIRQKLLGSSQRTFDGYHAALTLSYGQIESKLTYLWLNGDVRGLSGGQVIASVSLRAALASGLLKRE